MSGFSVFNRVAAPAPAPQRGGNWGLSTDLAGRAEAPNNRPLFTNFQATPAFQGGRVVDVEPLPFDHLEKPGDKEKKYHGGTNPVQRESEINEMTPPAHLSIELKNRAYDNLVLAAYNQHGPGALIPSPELLQAQLTAIATARRQSLDIELTRQINGEIVDNFRQWLLKKGSREDHVRAGWWPTITNRAGVKVPDPKVPKFLQAGGALSDHPSVRAYLDSFVNARVDYERDLVMMRLEASHGAMQDWSIDKLWRYYKFGVLGLKPDAEIDEIMDNVVPPPVGTVPQHSAALPPSGLASSAMAVDSVGTYAGQLDEATAMSLTQLNEQAQDAAALQAEQVELQKQLLQQNAEHAEQVQAEWKRLADAAEKSTAAADAMRAAMKQHQEQILLAEQQRIAETNAEIARLKAEQEQLKQFIAQKHAEAASLRSGAAPSSAPTLVPRVPMDIKQESPDISIHSSDLGKVLPKAEPTNADILSDALAARRARVDTSMSDASGSDWSIKEEDMGQVNHHVADPPIKHESQDMGQHGDTPDMSVDPVLVKAQQEIDAAKDELARRVHAEQFPAGRTPPHKEDPVAPPKPARKPAPKTTPKAPVKRGAVDTSLSDRGGGELKNYRNGEQFDVATTLKNTVAPLPAQDPANVPLPVGSVSTNGTSSTIDYGAPQAEPGIAAHEPSGKGKEKQEDNDPKRPPLPPKAQGQTVSDVIDHYLDRVLPNHQERGIAQHSFPIRQYVRDFIGNAQMGPDADHIMHLVFEEARAKGLIQ